ncbi:hypothetical protein [Microbacterium halotolerans]|uniref:hypothetical protein n=1 Tax=Microbacterium halotolerans TaxID=246613 RepID=UPI000E6AA0F7|nr:hypothetical protein [Microbacterium halotolerans]
MSTVTTIDAADISVTRVLSMSTPDLGWLAAGLLPATANDEVFGVKQHAHIVADELTAIMTATDGHRVHQVHVPLQAPVEHVEVVVPRDVLVWAKKNARTFKPKRDALIDPVAQLVLEVPAISDEGMPAGWAAAIYREWDSEEAPSARFDAPLVKETYPNINRIIDMVRRSTPSGSSPIPLSYLADAQALQTTNTSTPTIEYTRRESDGKAGPALIDFWEQGVLRATALIQPTTQPEGDES